MLHTAWWQYKSGIDCSAFVQEAFRDQFGVELPRSTSDQQFAGTKVNRSTLKAGDLVLFKTGRTMRHIGIYIGNDKFVHASTSSGVIVSENVQCLLEKPFLYSTSDH